MARLEHANITVSEPLEVAEALCPIFGWKIRWQGESIYGGFSVHVGDDDHYLALYAPPKGPNSTADTYHQSSGLNHIGLVVDDLDAAEERVKAAGFHPTSHADYEPGRRFYFDGPGGLEYELVSYV